MKLNQEWKFGKWIKEMGITLSFLSPILYLFPNTRMFVQK
jgi:hypothetical protein